jgi:hypothetical protein
MSGNFTVLNEYEAQRLKKLENFYQEIRRIANSSNLAKAYPVYEALSKIDPKWNEGPN